jgi:hypothetical protein
MSSTSMAPEPGAVGGVVSDVAVQLGSMPMTTRRLCAHGLDLLKWNMKGGLHTNLTSLAVCR